MSDRERVALAAEAFIYGYPLVADLWTFPEALRLH
jgi:hypothetical protein